MTKLEDLEIDYNGDGSKIVLRLCIVYFSGVLIINTVGLSLVLACIVYFIMYRKKLNAVFVSYLSVIVPDLSIAANFLFRDLAHITEGRLQPGFWCKTSGFVALAAMTAYNVGSVCISYTTYRMVHGNPLTINQVYQWIFASWATGLVLAAIYFVGDLVGPYKGLYCCIKETQYKAYAVAPGFIVLITAIYAMCYFYYESYKFIKAAEMKRGSGGGGDNKASRTVFRRGLILVSLFYICWSVMLTNGVLTSFMIQVHPGWDILAAWMAKLLPTIDSVFLLQMFWRLAARSSGAGPNSKAVSSAAESV